MQDKLSKTIIGNPTTEGVKMGSLAGIDQKKKFIKGLLKNSQEIIFGSLEDFDVVDEIKIKDIYVSNFIFK